MKFLFVLLTLFLVIPNVLHCSHNMKNENQLISQNPDEQAILDNLNNVGEDTLRSVEITSEVLNALSLKNALINKYENLLEEGQFTSKNDSSERMQEVATLSVEALIGLIRCVKFHSTSQKHFALWNFKNTRGYAQIYYQEIYNRECSKDPIQNKKVTFSTENPGRTINFSNPFLQKTLPLNKELPKTNEHSQGRSLKQTRRKVKVEKTLLFKKSLDIVCVRYCL